MEKLADLADFTSNSPLFVNLRNCPSVSVNSRHPDFASMYLCGVIDYEMSQNLIMNH